MSEAFEPSAAVRSATLLAATGDLDNARSILESAVGQTPSDAVAWLALARVREAAGAEPFEALSAYYQAVTRSQLQGRWIDAATTPAPLLDTVVHAIEKVRSGRRELLWRSYEPIRAKHGADALKRVDRALAVYLREIADSPASAHQRPRLFYFPDLDPGPYHDPRLHPWASTLAGAFESIRAEACRVLAEDSGFESYLDLPENADRSAYLGGQAPSWDAFFFYRHGRRYDAQHARCPQTSALLESIELCRIDSEAPEICFSVMAPGTHILPHYGVTNVRSVMHLPLVVPPGCALHVFGGGEHSWKPGQLVLFDDTYLHEAWNRSDSPRIILLMDCWNPHLDAAEKQALRALIETISTLGRCNRASSSD